MSELKAIRGGDIHDDVEFVYDDEDRASVLYYLKSEADRVIADLEESHKKEVEQLLIEIVKLKYKLSHKTEFAIQCQLAAHTLQQKLRHQKYKRCLAMAKWCRTSARYDEGIGAFKYRDWYWKWFKRWLDLADKFKPNSTAR